MLKEQEPTIVQPNEFLTVFDVWKKILNEHPYVVQQSAVAYALIMHGQNPDERLTILPRERIYYELDGGERNFYGQPGYIKAIGGRVEIGPPDLDLSLDTPQSTIWYDYGGDLEFNPKFTRSFIFADIESAPTDEALALFIRSLKNWRSDWYILDSGDGFHLIIDQLVPSDDLPKYYGQLIVDVASQLSPAKNVYYSQIGNLLIHNWYGRDGLAKWAKDILENFGHRGDPINSERSVFPLDLRYIAHSIEKLLRDQPDLICLRVGQKHGSVPILKAVQTDGQIVVFNYKDDPFKKRQPSLPTL
jgi:hypothetical protein